MPGKGCCHHTCTDCPNLPRPQSEAHCFNQTYLGLLQRLANPITTRLLQNTSTQSHQHCSSAGLLSSQDPSSNPLPRPVASLEVERRHCFVPFPLLPQPQSFPSLLHWLLNAKDSFLSQYRLCVWWGRAQSFSSSFGRCLNVKPLCSQYLAEPGPGSWRVFGGCIIS